MEHLKPLLPAGGDASELEAAAQALAGLFPEDRDLLAAVQESPYRLTTLEQFREFPANTEYFVLEPNIRKVEDVGWRYLAQHLDALLPPELLDAIDPVPFGNHAMQEEQGCFTSKGYLTLSGDEWEHERPRERQTEKKPSIKERLEQSRKECANQSKAQPHREKPAPERGGVAMPHYDYDKEYPFAAFITNLGKYNEGALVGEWVKFPTTAEELKKVFERIGIGAKDDFGQTYEEWFITDYDCYVDGLYDLLGEYANLDELNYLASKLDDMSQDKYERFQAAMEIGDHTGSIQELINLTENLDCYDIYPDIHDHDDLGRYYIEELDAMQVPEHLRNYIDYEAYGRDIALEESGQFTDLGYVRDTGDSFHEYYDGERGSIPEEYRVMTFQDDIPEEEISEWAMDLAYDMDEFFRQHDPQYAAEYPEEHAAKEEIYENLMAGRISALDEKLAALGQTQEDYLPSEIEKFKDATGYEEFLDVDPQAIREAIENPDQSHVDEMLSFAEQANREYEAELYGQQAAPTPDDRETGETVRTPRGTFHVTDMSREQMEAAGYGFHHESEDGKYLIMANGSRAFAIPNGDAPEHTAPQKLTVLVVEPMKEPYVKEIDPGLHALQAEVGGDIAASYPFDDPVGLVLNDEGKLIGLDLNRSLRDEHGEIYDIVAGTFLVVGLGPESFASLPPDMIQKYTEQFKRPELFASINGQIVSVPVEPENPLRAAEMTLEDDYGMIDGIINNGRRGEELEKAQAEARRTTPEKKPSIRERLEDAKRECGSRKAPDKPAPQKKPPEMGDL